MTKVIDVNHQVDNQQKYENYRTQSRKLSHALRSGFYLEAVFIEYAIIEDRLESALRHAGAYNPKAQKTITTKISKLEKVSENKRGLACRYFSKELFEAIRKWKEQRNLLVHELMKQDATTEGFEEVALWGKDLVKTLKSKVRSFNRASDHEEARAQS